MKEAPAKQRTRQTRPARPARPARMLATALLSAAALLFARPQAASAQAGETAGDWEKGYKQYKSEILVSPSRAKDPSAGTGRGGAGHSETAARSTERLSASDCEEDRSKDLFQLDFSEADITDVVRQIADLTCRNFIIDQKVRGKITIISPTKITVDEAWAVFLSVLQVNDLTIVRSGKVYKIIQSQEAPKSSIETLMDEQDLPRDDTYITQLIPLEYVDAQQIAGSLKPLASKHSNLIAYPPTNTVIITDTGANIRRILRIIEEIDVEIYKPLLEVIPIRYASADTIAREINEIFAPSPSQRRGAAARRATPRPTPRRTGATIPSAQPYFEPGEIKVITDERTNAIIVLAPRVTMETVKKLVAKLDSDIEVAGNIHVHYLENADAEDLAETLTGLIGGSGGRAGAPAVPGAAPGPIVRPFEADIKIEADAPTNALVIEATPEDYRTLKEIILKLDIKRPQVLVEALILEVSVDPRTVSQGVTIGGVGTYAEGRNSEKRTQVFSGNTAVAGTPALIDQDTLNSILTAGATGSSLLTVIRSVRINGEPAPVIQAAIDASARNNNANIISAPHVLTVDNEEAEIVVGQNIPVITSRLQTPTGTTAATDPFATSVQVERQDVAVTLRVTPQISEGDAVRLEVFQEITTLIGQDPDLGPTLGKRSVENTVVVSDGDTIVIGGIISDQDTEDITKIPFLADLPVFGYFFKSTTRTVRKTNLLIFLTPHIARSQADMRRITDFKQRQFRRKSQESKDRLPSDEQLDLGWDVHSKGPGSKSRVARAANPVSAGAAAVGPPPAAAAAAAVTPNEAERAAVQENPSEEEEKTEGTETDSPFTIQVGVFKTIEEAEALFQRLREKTYDAYIFSTDEPDAGALHRVRVGSFTNEIEAKRAGAEIERTERLIAFVVQSGK